MTLPKADFNKKLPNALIDYNSYFKNVLKHHQSVFKKETTTSASSRS